MDALKELEGMQGRILALESIIRSQLVDRALENNSPVSWLDGIREAMQGPLRQARQGAYIPSNKARSEGAKALEELFRQAETEVRASLARTTREFSCD